MGRLIRSSSVGGSTDFVGRIKPFRPPIATTSAAASTTGQINRPVVQKKPIFTLTSPPRDEIWKDDRRKIFADVCASCNKEIPEDRERYMYGYLQAFCSTICRDNQIALNEEFNAPSPPRGAQLSGNFIKRKLLKVKFDK